MNNKRVGILGFAHGHVFSYCAKWKECPDMGVSVVVGWDRDPVRAQEACDNIGAECSPSAETLLARDDVDAVVIASETLFHAELVEKAAETGKDIILQKPIALSMAQADRIVDAVNAAGVSFTIAWQMRVDPHNLEAKKLLETKDFGKIYQIRRRHCLSTQNFPNFDETWHVKEEYNRDIFADDAAHPVDFIYWLMGMPVSVVAEIGTLGNPKIKNDNAIALFRYADGAFAEVSCSFVNVAGENSLEIFCEKGTIISNYGDAPSCAVPRLAGSVQLKWYLQGDESWNVSDLPDVLGQGERISGLAGPLADFLHGRRSPIATAEEGRNVLKLVQACYDSDQHSKRITIQSTD